MSDEKLMNIDETAKFLGVSVISVWRKLETRKTKKEIDCYRVGRRVLLSMENHILPYLKRCEKKAEVN